MPQFRGEIQQLPPMYSALQKDGVRLYTLARQGIEVEREPRAVTIRQLELTAANEAENRYEIEVACSAGTYIRSLISDLGEALGTGAVMTALCRTQANGCTLDGCFTLEKLQARRDAGTLQEAVLPVDALLPKRAIRVTEAQAKRFSNGGALALDRLRDATTAGIACVYAPDGQFLGAGEVDLPSGELKVKKVF